MAARKSFGGGEPELHLISTPTQFQTDDISADAGKWFRLLLTATRPPTPVFCMYCRYRTYGAEWRMCCR
jgi:hypothetical protein